ncbi:YafY family protein [uncultured Aquimarina sp.]|uniref:helix-turn-helix transcriptional regulator n=1 Tax=uncultured Aquimarina sp. TaxID=575652 RepID=UPI00262088FA|nr:YafY family protein [uncultured Aquimarina sp.]
MNRLTRITSILIQLQSKKVIIAKDIAERFEISVRTVYRDIKTLQDAGIPIGSENGKGYFLVEGFSLPPIMITEEEANALIISEKFIENQGDSSLKKDFSSLLFKIKAILRTSQKDNIELLEKRISPSYLKEPLKSNSLSIIQKAILNNQTLEISYRAVNQENITTRKIKPLATYFTSNAWVVIAFCSLRNDVREFRLDRIITKKLIEDLVSNQTDFDLTQYFQKKYQS